MKKINRNWIKMNRDNTSEEVVDQIENEIKEEEKMGLGKYKDKLILGALAGVASIIAALLIVNKIRSSDCEEFDDEEDLEIVDQDIASEFESGKVVNF